METQSFASSSTATVNADEMLITAMCTVGNPCVIEQSQLGAGAGSSPSRCHPTIVIGIALDSSKLSRSGSGCAEQARTPTYHPFIVVYQIAENGVVYADSGVAGGRSG
uniref:Uncharacterized protein n=1 Tax=Parascaris equorum TaxID=6256 RepID=A0A914R860_PAREQ